MKKTIKNKKRVAPNKYPWTVSEIKFIEDNYSRMTNHELAHNLGVSIHLIRTKCYELGLKRIELEYWTKEQVRYLRLNYKTKGDVEITEVFNDRWHKDKGWTKKHIEKKRRQLGLHRTQEQIDKIFRRNVKAGRMKYCAEKRWAKTGQAPEGTIRYWRNRRTEEGYDYEYPVVKVGQRWRAWKRWAWEQHYGEIPKGMNVVFKDGNNRNLTIKNLVLMTDAQLAKMSARTASVGLSDNYVAWTLTRKAGKRKTVPQELIDLKRTHLILQRTIKQKQYEATGK